MKKTTIALLSFLSLSIHALETDQFHAAMTDLKESSAAINGYVTGKMQTAVDKANKKKKTLSCDSLSDEVMTEIVGRYSISAISAFARNSPDVERFPEDNVEMKDYINQSIYRDAGFPFAVFGTLSKTINIGDVYIGTDKLGHFALIGRNYYRRFLELKAKGLSDAVAEKEAVMTGIKQEVHVLGYTLGGVLSFGDLEANYQGLMFARSLCKGTNPFILKKEGQWVLNNQRSFDIKNYINPKMDESFQFAFWKERIWNDIKPALKEVYCDLKKETKYQERMKSYAARIESNRNDQYVAEYFKDKKEFNRDLRDLNKLCD